MQTAKCKSKRKPMTLQETKQFISAMLEIGCDINQQEGDGNGFLHHACKRTGDKTETDIVEYLLQQKNIKIMVKNGEGKTPLRLASENGLTAIYELLVNKIIEGVVQLAREDGKNADCQKEIRSQLEAQRNNIGAFEQMFADASKGATTPLKKYLWKFKTHQADLSSEDIKDKRKQTRKQKQKTQKEMKKSQRKKLNDALKKNSQFCRSSVQQEAETEEELKQNNVQQAEEAGEKTGKEFSDDSQSNATLAVNGAIEEKFEEDTMQQSKRVDEGTEEESQEEDDAGAPVIAADETPVVGAETEEGSKEEGDEESDTELLGGEVEGGAQTEASTFSLFANFVFTKAAKLPSEPQAGSVTTDSSSSVTDISEDAEEADFISQSSGSLPASIASSSPDFPSQNSGYCSTSTTSTGTGYEQNESKRVKTTPAYQAHTIYDVIGHQDLKMVTLQRVKENVQSHPLALDVPHETEGTTLHAAIRKFSAAIQGKDKNSVGYALICDRLIPIVKYIAERIAAPNGQDKNGRTALRLAVDSGDQVLLQTLLGSNQQRKMKGKAMIGLPILNTQPQTVSVPHTEPLPNFNPYHATRSVSYGLASSPNFLSAPSGVPTYPSRSAPSQPAPDCMTSYLLNH